MREGYGSRSVCECVCVCYSATSYISLLLVSSVVLQGSLWRMYCVDLPENALFSSFGVICIEPLPSTFPGEFSMERMNISGLFYRYKVCSFSNSCYKSTNSELAINYASWLYFVLIWHARLLLRNTMQSVLVHSCGYCLQHCYCVIGFAATCVLAIANQKLNILAIIYNTKIMSLLFLITINLTAPRVWHQWCSLPRAHAQWGKVIGLVIVE
jgi:hypothetical protein